MLVAPTAAAQFQPGTVENAQTTERFEFSEFMNAVRSSYSCQAASRLPQDRAWFVVARGLPTANPTRYTDYKQRVYRFFFFFFPGDERPDVISRLQFYEPRTPPKR